MKAATFRGIGSWPQIEEVAKPAIERSTDALIRVTLSSICGSDLHILHGHSPVEEGAILGHELVGVVEEVGGEVNRFKVGDRVVAAFYTSCGHCPLCRRGWFSQCQEKATFGHGEYFGGLGGGQAEYCLIPRADYTLELIPPGVSDEKAVFVGDGLATAYFAAERAEITPGDTVAVIGAGPIGLLSIMTAQLFGPAQIIVVDMVEERLRIAEELGAHPINSTKAHPIEAIQAMTGEVGADSCIECVGKIEAVQSALECVRGGGTVSTVGVPSEVQADFPYADAWLRDLTFRSGWCNVQLYMERLLALVAAGRLKPERLISHRFSLDQVDEAYRLFEARQAIKVVLTP